MGHTFQKRESDRGADKSKGLLITASEYTLQVESLINYNEI